jgi:hypothetical protein
MEEDKLSLSSQERVLIEKDGQFELVPTSDVRAQVVMMAELTENEEDTTTDDHHDVAPTPSGVESNNAEEPDQSKLVESMQLEATNSNTPPASDILVHKDESLAMNDEPLPSAPSSSAGDHADQLPLANAPHVQSSTVVNNGLPSSSSEPPTATNESPSHSNGLPSTDNDSELTSTNPPAAPSSVSSNETPAIIHTEPTSEQKSNVISTAEANDVKTTTHQETSQPATPQIKRKSVSAPANRKTQEDIAREKELLNEKAFQKWIEKKNIELEMKRNAERRKVKGDDESAKVEMNRKAFEAWLRNKRRQLHSTQSVDDNDGGQENDSDKRKKNEENFKMWLSKKAEQRAYSASVERAKRREMEEVGKKVDMKLADAAYKEWLKKKRIEAKINLDRQKQYRKLFFQESRQLHTSLTHRFQGF